MTSNDGFRESALLGSALTGEVVIDAHMHLGKFYNFFIPRSDVVARRSTCTPYWYPTDVRVEHSGDPGRCGGREYHGCRHSQGVS